MCGRYTMVNLKSFVDDLPWASLFEGGEEMGAMGGELGGARYNIAPTQGVAMIGNRGDAESGKLVGRVEVAHWGLIPSWAKDPSVGSRMINARAETLAEKPSFRTALKRRRCIIPADGFYEWKVLPDGKKKQPMYIRMKTGKPFAFAGLWEVWRPPPSPPTHAAPPTPPPPAGSKGDGRVVSCTVITTEPNELMAGIHNRMPVILPRERYLDWLAVGERDAGELGEMLVPLDAGLMEAWPVGTAVGNPRNDSAENVVRVG